MTKTLQSLLEMAVVIVGLAGTPLVVVASFGSADTAVQTQHLAQAAVPAAEARF